MSYQPGTHIIATLHAGNTGKMVSYENCKKAIDALIGDFGLHKLGEVYHDFTPEGFTAVVCLSESHLSIHTWPEHNKVNLDIYLSNFRRSNDETVVKIYEALVNYFEATPESCETIYR